MNRISPVDEAHQHISETIAGLTTSETAEGNKYRTTDGMLVVIVGRRPSGSGDVRATLAYRTEPASELATRKAAKIREALKPYLIQH